MKNIGCAVSIGVIGCSTLAAGGLMFEVNGSSIIEKMIEASNFGRNSKSAQEKEERLFSVRRYDGLADKQIPPRLLDNMFQLEGNYWIGVSYEVDGENVVAESFLNNDELRTYFRNQESNDPDVNLVLEGLGKLFNTVESGVHVTIAQGVLTDPNFQSVVQIGDEYYDCLNSTIYISQEPGGALEMHSEKHCEKNGVVRLVEHLDGAVEVLPVGFKPEQIRMISDGETNRFDYRKVFGT